MEDFKELKTFIKLWSFAIVCISLCYFISNRISSVKWRLFFFLPVITTFFFLPIPLSSVHLTLATFFHLAWLANFKILLLAFNRGPLASTPPLPIVVFLTIAVLPINPVQTNTKISNAVCGKLDVVKSVSDGSNQPKVISSNRMKDAYVNYLAYKKDPDFYDLLSFLKPVLFAAKVLLLSLILNAYQYKDSFNQNFVLFLYFTHFYLVIEIVFAAANPLVWLLIGYHFQIEPQFNEPYLASSLQDFWGRRWNRMASRILRPFFYDPVRLFWTPILGKLWGQMLGIIVTFVASGLIHELMYAYVTCVWPTWEVTWFFVLHGVCSAVELAVKKAVNGRFQLPWLVSGPITLSFVLETGFWLFFPQIVRNGVDVQAINEYSILVKTFTFIFE
uniref:Probable long-chain-alcohol O-fatty-acyltransferase 5 n=1 Tax=Tanacetum cinerariifolium TaxID=118510 RepID=A0A699JI97_TANCI|nr:probable long-chain-alcohol O-fatty-acyltransferase 5 [Tanacetum cinerariifolium]